VAAVAVLVENGLHVSLEVDAVLGLSWKLVARDVRHSTAG
jgi:hypothetical protein